MRRGSFHPQSALLSVGITAGLLAAFLEMGAIRTPRAKQVAALTLFDLRAPQGNETAATSGAPVPPTPAAQPPAAPSPPPRIKVSAPPPVTLAAPQAQAPLPLLQPGPVAPGPAAAPASAPATAAPGDGSTITPAATARPDAVDGFKGTTDSNSRSYAARVRSWLLAHKLYPRRAKMRRIEGIVRVHFTLDRSGRLIEGAVVGTSGDTSLDDEGAAMLHRASPYPPAPRDVVGERIAFTAPIEFSLAR